MILTFSQISSINIVKQELPIARALWKLRKNRLEIDCFVAFCDDVDPVWEHGLFLPLEFFSVLLYPLQRLLDQLLPLLNLLFRARRSSLDVVDQLWPLEQVLKGLGTHQLRRVDRLRGQDVAERGRLQRRCEDPVKVKVRRYLSSR